VLSILQRYRYSRGEGGEAEGIEEGRQADSSNKYIRARGRYTGYTAGGIYRDTVVATGLYTGE
jgi:hypothetical protein